MSTSGKSLSASVSDFVRQSKSRLDAVVKQSVQELVTDMQTPVGDGGNMPVDTGFLRASLRLNFAGPVSSSESPTDGATYSYDPSAVSLVVAGFSPGKVLYGSYVARYAAAVHYGTSKRQGRQWVALAAQRWPQIVEGVCGRLAAKSQSSESEELS